jgi:hypothetical protein
MRIEGIVLKYESDIAVARRRGVDSLAADVDAAARGAFQPGDDAQQRGLAASRRSEQNTELAVGDIEGNLI